MEGGNKVMDTSELYIKMCDCPEIQGQWEAKDLDVFYHRGDKEGHWKGLIIGLSEECDKEDCDCDNCGWGTKEHLRKYGIWLPRQDQIQEMLGITSISIKTLVIRFSEFCCTEGDESSMEQLWLAFYVHERHSKIWSSKEEKWALKN